LLAEHWPGRWIIPDFRGHGRSFHHAPYGIGVHAADVAGLLQPDEEVSLVGHSMGGAVSVALATGMFGIQVRRAVAFCVKVDWSEEDLARAKKVAAAPPRLFDTREEAIERCLRVAGLKELAAPSSRVANVGVAEQQGKFRLATDPLVNTTGKPDFAAIAQAARAPIHLLSGENDNIGHAEGMRRLSREVRVLPGLGHNPHVEAPEAFWRAIESDLRSA
jgi:pimeloyl-ACP methyl ester carboxylesterase